MLKYISWSFRRCNSTKISNEKICSFSEDNIIKIWNINNGERIMTLENLAQIDEIKKLDNNKIISYNIMIANTHHS